MSIDKKRKRQFVQKNNQLKKYIDAHIQDEKKENSLYPLYTTEQLILAFFAQHFHSKADIYDLMKALDSKLITAEFIQDRAEFSSDLWTRENLALAADPLDLDAIFIRTYHDLNSPIPYVNKQTPIPNTLTHVPGSHGRSTFVNCNETTLRHLANFAFWDAEKRYFVIPDSIENKALREFFVKQTPSRVSDGSFEMSDLWNHVVADRSGVKYLRSGYELDGKNTNLIQVLRSITGYRTDQPLPNRDEDITQEIKLLLIHMNPTFREVTVTPWLDIAITNKLGQKFLFGIRTKEGISPGSTHSEISAPHWEKRTVDMPPSPEMSDPILNLVDQRHYRKGVHRLLAQGEIRGERFPLRIVEAHIPHLTT